MSHPPRPRALRRLLAGIVTGLLCCLLLMSAAPAHADSGSDATGVSATPSDPPPSADPPTPAATDPVSSDPPSATPPDPPSDPPPSPAPDPSSTAPTEPPTSSTPTGPDPGSGGSSPSQPADPPSSDPGTAPSPPTGAAPQPASPAPGDPGAATPAQAQQPDPTANFTGGPFPMPPSVMASPTAAGSSGAAPYQSSTSIATRAISRAEILQRAKQWVVEGVPYSQTAWWTDSLGTYRQDCSGYVSMAWRLDEQTNFWTGNLGLVSHPITAAELQPGDILLSASHTLIFAGWSDAAHTTFNMYEESHPGTDAHFATGSSYSYYAGHGFVPYRYDLVQDSDLALMSLTTGSTPSVVPSSSSSSPSVLAQSVRPFPPDAAAPAKLPEPPPEAWGAGGGTIVDPPGIAGRSGTAPGPGASGRGPLTASGRPWAAELAAAVVPAPADGPGPALAMTAGWAALHVLACVRGLHRGRFRLTPPLSLRPVQDVRNPGPDLPRLSGARTHRVLRRATRRH